MGRPADSLRAQAEIEDVARLGRSSGRLPPEIERAADEVYARLAPARAGPERRSPLNRWRADLSQARRYADDQRRRWTARRRPPREVKVAFVVPRYGPEVLGGAEYAARMLAERLVSRCGWPVEVFTTCAQDAVSWADSYPEERSVINGVVVHRYRSESGRAPEFDALANRVGLAPATTSPQEAALFIEQQGPVCPAAVKAALATDAELLVFYPYLYYPTVAGVPAAGGRAVLHPAAHDEPWLRLPVFRSVFEQAGALVFQTYEERQLVQGLFPVSHHRQLVLGLGVERQTAASDLARLCLGIGDDPYLLTIGRLEDGKGTGMLARFFAEYKARRPGQLKLVMGGQIVQSPPSHDDIIIAGPLTDEVKWSALAGAVSLVQPSYFEAFSLVLMEAWASGIPALVNGSCRPLREHCVESRAGLWFTGYATFEAAVDRLAADDGLRLSMGRRGSRYVERRYSWPVIIDRYAAFLQKTADAKR